MISSDFEQFFDGKSWFFVFAVKAGLSTPIYEKQKVF